MDPVGSDWFAFSMIAEVVLQVLMGIPFLFLAPFLCCIIPAIINLMKTMSDVEGATGASAEGNMNKMMEQMINMTRVSKVEVFTTRQNLVTLVEKIEGDAPVEGEGAEEKPADE